MALPNENISMALFCDFENVALGVRDAKYEKFDIKPVLERLLLKGSIVVKKAYCDWERYKGFKAGMHEANFELIEIPHVRQSGKNSADIRLVVDALDLCYTKSHVNTFVIISGDSDFSPLVSKLRENAKQVIGVGVKQSTSDLLMANCDEFIFYDDLVREQQRAAAKRENRGAPASAAKRSPEEEKRRKDESEARKREALDLVEETFEALLAERGENGKIWASVLKDAIKRRKPHFNEAFYGFRAFGSLLEEAQARGLLEFGRDEKSGAYVFRSNGGPARADATPRETPEAPATQQTPTSAADTAHASAPSPAAAKAERGRRARGRNPRKQEAAAEAGNAGEQTSAVPAHDAAADGDQIDGDANHHIDQQVVSKDSQQSQPEVDDASAAMPAIPTPAAAAPREAGRPRRPARKRASSGTGDRPEQATAPAADKGPTTDTRQPHAAAPAAEADVRDAAPATAAPDKVKAATAAKPRRTTTGGRRPRKPAASGPEE